MPRRRKAIAQRGSGVLDTIKSFIQSVAPVAHNIVKDNKLISRGLTAAGIPGLPMVASALGYGRRKHRRGGRRKRSTVLMR